MRLAVAAPWVLLALLSLRPESVAAYDGRTGASVIAGGAALCLIAYRAMLRIAPLLVTAAGAASARRAERLRPAHGRGQAGAVTGLPPLASLFVRLS